MSLDGNKYYYVLQHNDLVNEEALAHWGLLRQKKNTTQRDGSHQILKKDPALWNYINILGDIVCYLIIINLWHLECSVNE